MQEPCTDRSDIFLGGETPPVLPRCFDGEIEMLIPENTDHVPQNDAHLDMTHLNESLEKVQEVVRCSDRQRTRPKRLHYTELGHPLIEVVQSLFQGLSSAGELIKWC